MWYALLKLATWIFIAFVVGWYVRPRWAFWFFAILGILESIIGFIQFITHKSVGLYMVGEPFLSPLNRDIARTFIEGGRLLRAYGTFPHPNILGAFLILSFFSLLWLFVQYGKNRTIRIVFAVPIFIVLLGLLLTFSRAAWLAAVIGSIIVLWNITHLTIARRVILYKLFIIITLSLASLIFIFKPVVVPRLSVIDTFAVQERIPGFNESFVRIAEHPWFGSGLTLAMPMDRAPTHNLYLLIAEEVGLIGLTAFLLFFISILYIGSWEGEIGILKTMFIALLIAGLFDHFLWTLRPGAAMLWVVIGLVAGSGRRSHS